MACPIPHSDEQVKSSDAKAAAGAGWRAANFALETAVDVQAEIAKALETVKCPGDFTGAVQTACAVALNVAIPVRVWLDFSN